jgi:DNA polymerase III subunit gamma/tau
MSLITKYRPNKLENMLGNQNVVDSLIAMRDKREEIPHTFLFTGDSGCGKTTFGRIIAKELFHCHPDDMCEVDAAQYTGIDAMREIRQKMRYLPMSGPARVWLLDECHMLSSQAQESLLKALEEPPKHVYFILCTTEPGKLKDTFKRRCSWHEVSSLTEKEIIRLLKQVEKAEQAELMSKEVCRQIAQDSLGRPGLALQILDSVIALPEEKRLIAAKKSAEMNSEVIELCRALINGKDWGTVSKILKGLQKEDPEKIRRAVLGYMNSVLLGGQNALAYNTMEEFIDPFYDGGKPQLTFACYRIVLGSDATVPF